MKKIFLLFTLALVFSLILAFTGGQALAASTVSFQSAVNYDVGIRPYGVAVGDFNSDGMVDMVVANSGSNNVSILMNKGDGTSQSAVNYTAGTSPRSVAVGDFNSDGLLDLAVANSGSNNVSTMMNNGDGTFHSAVNYTVGSGSQSVAVGDFNGDGKPDIATANSYTSNVSVLMNKGDGTFHSAVNYTVGRDPESVAVGDFNGDGKPDIVTANSRTYWVSVLVNKGDGTFQPTVNYTVGSVPHSVAVGDFNGDGKPDIATANSWTLNISVLMNKEDGTFQTAFNYNVGTYPLGLAVGDFNSDGKPDLVVANRHDFNISILMNNGDGTFQLVGNFTVGVGPDYRASGNDSVAVGDLNGDGKPDIAVANGSSNNISILLNTTASLAITTTNLPASTAGTPYNTTLAATGGTAPYSWSATGLPDGLSMDSNGTITGTPTTAGTYTVSVKVRDNGGLTATANLGLTVNPPPDTVPPTTTLTLSGTAGNNGWYVSDVQAALTAADNPDGSGVVTTEYSFDSNNWITYTERFNITNEGQTTVYYRSTDKAGNIEATKEQVIKIDKTAPVISGAATTQPNANGWYNTDVTVHFTATDAVSGIASETPDAVISTEGAAQSVTGTAVDQAGNSASYTVSGINIDKTAPQISINLPAGGGQYNLGQQITSDWSAVDALSGLQSATGTTMSGSIIDTTTVGVKTYKVTANDQAGNEASKIVNYQVVYVYSGILQPADGKVCKLGSTVPVKFWLKDDAGNFVNNAIAELFVAKITDGSAQDVQPAASTSKAAEGNLFRYDSTDNQYIFNFNTKGLSTGLWQLRIGLDDGTVRYGTINLK